MTTPEILPRVFFSLRPEVKQCAHYITDFQILYPAGSVLILHNYYEKRQRYINLHDKCVFLEQIIISYSRKLVAIILNGEKGQIVVYDLGTLKKKRTLNLPPDSTTNRFETIAFTHDDLYIIAITGEPDWNLVVYNWSKGKLTSCSKAVSSSIPVSRIQLYCSPTDSSEIFLAGPGVFRLLSRMETVWRQYGFQKADQINITSGAWLTSTRILCGSADGKLFVIDNSDLRAVYSAFSVNLINLKERDEASVVGSSSMLMMKSMSEFPETEDVAVRALISFPKGFAYSCRSGTVFLFEKEAPNKYKKRNVFKIVDSDLVHLPQSELNVIKHLSLNVSYDKLLATTGRAQLYSVRLWGPDMNVAPEIPFKILGEPLHHGPVNGLSMCIWKPVFATSGKLDRTIRLWNYETETVQLVKHFPEEIYCIHLHPTGNFIAVGFADRVDISIILMNDIQLLRSLPVPACELCEFSFSGHYLAAVHQGCNIEIFGTVMMNSVFSLKGHLGKIKALQWIMDDKRLGSCSTEGEIFLWDTVNGTLLEDIRTPGVTYQDISFTCDGKNVYAVDSEGDLKMFNNTLQLMSLQFPNICLEKILLSRSNLMMFMSGGLAGVLSVKLPLSDPPDFVLFKYHASRVSQLKFSFDDQTLVTISGAGTVIIWKLNLAEGKTANMDKNFVHSTEVLINKQELEKKILTIKDLSQKLYELEMGQARETRDTESSFCEKIKEIHEKYNQNIEELKEKIEHAEADQNKQLEDIKKEIDELQEKQEKEKSDLIENYTTKLLVEYEKVRSLVELKDETIRDFENRLAELEQSKEEETNELINAYQQKLAEANDLLQQTYEENAKNITEHETIKQQLENDANREIVETKAKFEGLLKEEIERNGTLKEEATIMRKNFAEAQKEKNEYREKLQELQVQLQKLQSNILAREKDVMGLKAEIVERDTTAEEKDDKIFMLKKKILEMDKFKFVLDYKMEELKKEIDPKNREIREQKEQIADMEIELNNLKKINSSLELQLIELKEKINGTEKDIQAYESKHLCGVNTMKQIRVDIYSVFQDLNDHKKLKDGIKDLYHKYHECDITCRQQYGESDIQKELLVQREFLERTIKSLNSTKEKSTRGKTDSSRVVQDNVLLLEELNMVRQDLRETTLAVNNLAKLVGVKGTKSVIPSEAFNKMQQALTKQQDMRQKYQEVIDSAYAETVDLQSKATKMQEKLLNLLDTQNK